MRCFSLIAMVHIARLPPFHSGDGFELLDMRKGERPFVEDCTKAFCNTLRERNLVGAEEGTRS